jgi:diguanylate cyclase (GGDEF)-like protein
MEAEPLAKGLAQSGEPGSVLRRLRLGGPFATGRGRLLSAIWVMLTLVALALVLASDLGRARAQFQQLGSELLLHVSDRSLVSETALEAFAAYVAPLEGPDYEPARGFAASLLERYPFLYMFEVAVRVDAGERAAFERRMAQRRPDFAIRQFGFQSDRHWRLADESLFYYPLVFQEPVADGPADVVGLDIHSNPVLRQAMTRSFELGQPVATWPFDLAEEGRGYVLHRAVGHLAGRSPSAFEADEYVLLALKSAELFPRLKDAPARIDVYLAHREFAAGDPAAEVLARPAQPASRLESALLPRLSQDLQLELVSQPLTLRTGWQLGWQDISLGRVAWLLAGSLILFGVVRVLARGFIESELTALEQDGRLFDLANFDSLTGLANRNRLHDFLEGSLARARRRQLRVAVLFIDLDGFKAVNDEHGHAAGDLVLVEVAHRLDRHRREDELVARYGGDEFVWVTDGSTGRPEMDALVGRLRHEFEAPFTVGRLQVRLGLSVGCAFYPEDGRNLAALLEVADARMYLEKRRKRDSGVSPGADPVA